MNYSIIILAALAWLFMGNIAACQTNLEVKICKIRSGNGQILVSLYNSADQFPDQAPEGLNNLIVKKDKMKDGCLVIELNSLDAGSYALAFLDDENSSGDMDYNRLGLPLEGFGFSNNAKPLFSAPSYKKCLFYLKPGKNEIELEVQYR